MDERGLNLNILQEVFSHACLYLISVAMTFLFVFCIY